MVAVTEDAREDQHWMGGALALAERGLGNVWPNPSVGCVIVADGRAVGRGWTQRGGRPHAETEALKRAGAAARGATAYVTLEPCAHHGETPPCAEALVAAGIARVVVALSDPDPRVSGKGVEILAAAGLSVTTDCLRAEAEELNRGFLKRAMDGRPMVTLKVATSMDGRIATHGGDSQWITGEPARRYAHLLRARHDAIMVGSRTAIADQPRLTCRLPGLEDRSPVRLVTDSRLHLPLTDPLVAGAGGTPTWLLTLEAADAPRRRAFLDAGVEVIGLPADPAGRIDIAAGLKALGERGLTRVMIEGGGRLAANMLGAGVIDRIEWFRAPTLIGGDGIAALGPLGLERVADAPRYMRVSHTFLGDDVLESYVAAQ
jgi:diaminohydroxyphosphoribosylaminopyrimidine deaminase/5-amino-6-(5-phosphoribosylamino)uracil reductase